MLLSDDEPSTRADLPSALRHSADSNPVAAKTSSAKGPFDMAQQRIGCGSVAVIVAVRCQISATFQAFRRGSLCAQDLRKLLVNCESLENGCTPLRDS